MTPKAIFAVTLSPSQHTLFSCFSFSILLPQTKNQTKSETKQKPFLLPAESASAMRGIGAKMLSVLWTLTAENRAH